MPDPDDRPVSISESGPVAIDGDVTMTGGVVAGRDLIIERLTVISDDGPPSGDAVARPGQPTDVCPYPGIAAFEDRHAAYFFGRDRDRDAVIELIGHARLVAVVGSSGSGKSSLLAAAVVPAVKGGALPGSDQWAVETLRPGVHPMEQLDAQLTPELNAPRLIVIDQLEEVFAAGVDPDERKAFFGALVAVTANADREIRVVVAMRSDFYPHLDVDQPMASAVAANQHRLVPLDPTAIRDVVVCPAEAVGLRVEDGLVEQILTEVEDNANVLPLLAYALQETWRRRKNGWLTLAGYVDSGGIAGALEQGAEKVWATLDTDQRGTARRIFLRLAYLGEGTAPARRSEQIEDLITDTDDAATVVAVLEPFLNARLLIADARGEHEAPIVEVAHEALLREWALLRTWFEDDLEIRRVQEDLAVGAETWTEHERDPAYLFRGARLGAIEASRARGEVAVNAVEREFIVASRRIESRQRRRSLGLAALAVGLVVAIAFAGVVVVQQRNTARQKTLADASQLAAEARSMVGPHRDLGVLLSLAAVATDNNPTTQGTLVDAIASPDGPVAYLTMSEGQATTLAPTLAADGSVVVGGSDRLIRFLSPVDGHETELSLTGHRDTISAVAVTADGLVVSGDGTGDVLLHEIGRPEPVGRINVAGSEVVAIVADTASGTIAVATRDGTVERRRLTDAMELVTSTKIAEGVASLLIEPVTGQLVVAPASGPIRRWSSAAASDVELSPLAGDLRGGSDFRVALAGAGHVLAVDGQRMQRWDLRQEPPTSSETAVDAVGATALATAPDGSVAFVGQARGDIKAWVTGSRLVETGTARRGLTSDVDELATDGVTLVGLDKEHHVIVWEVSGRHSPLAEQSHSHDSAVLAVAYAPDGTLATGGRAGDLWISAPDGTLRELPSLTGMDVTGLAWLPDNQLAVGASDGSVRVLGVESGVVLETAPRADSPVVGVASAADGSLAFARADGEVAVVNRQGTSRFQAPAADLTALAMSPDGRLLAVGSGNDEPSVIFVWSLDDPDREPRRLEGHGLEVTSLAFSPDGKTLASGSDDRTVRLWKMSSGDQVGELQGHTDMVRGLAFSTDGQVLASGGEDGTLRFWDVGRRVALGEPLRYDRSGGGNFIWALAVSPDGKTLAAADGTNVIAWGFGYEGWADRACRLARRDLSADEWATYAPGRDHPRLC